MRARQDRLTLVENGLLVSGLAFTADGKVLTAFDAEQVRLYDVATGKVLANFAHDAKDRELSPPLRPLQGRALLSPDGKTLAVSPQVAYSPTRLVDVATGKERARVFGNDWGAMVFSPDGTLLAAGCPGAIRIWETHTGRSRAVFRGHRNHLRNHGSTLLFAPDGRTLYSGGADDSTVRVWRVPEAEADTASKEGEQP